MICNDADRHAEGWLDRGTAKRRHRCLICEPRSASELSAIATDVRRIRTLEAHAETERIATQRREYEQRSDAWRAVYCESEDRLIDFLAVVDVIPANVLENGGEYDGPAVELVNSAESAGRLWCNDAGPVLVFLPFAEHTASLFTTQHLAEFCDVPTFRCAPDLPLAEMSRRLSEAGLSLDDFDPSPLAAWWTEDELAGLAGLVGLELESTDTPPPAAAEQVAALPDEKESAMLGADDSEAQSPRNQPLDLRRLRTEERAPVEYLEPGVIPRGRYIGLSGEAGAGKSVLMRDMAVRWSLGHSTFDPSHTFEPLRVVYLDAENGPAWWTEGLDKMDAPLDLPNLHVVAYPDLDGGLDTDRGARSFLELVESLGEIDMLMIDTASRFVSGSENDSDTWHALYRLAILPLRRAGIAVVRLDHLGKNAELGARGSSAKMSDLDAHYILTASAKGSNSLTLKLDKRRQADYAECVRISRSDNPLTHLRIPEGKLKVAIVDGREVPEDSKVAALVAELDRLHIAASLSRRVQQTDYGTKCGEVKAGTDTWAAAVKFRSERIDREAEQ